MTTLRLVSLVSIAMGTACSRDAATSLPHPVVTPRVVEPANVEDLARLRYVERFVPAGRSMTVHGFRVGAGLAAVLQSEPDARFQIEVAGMPNAPIMGGPLNRWSQRASPTRPALGTPSDVVGISAHSEALFLVPASRLVISESISGDRRAVTRLTESRSPWAGCMLDDTSLAYLDRRRPSTVVLHTFGTSARINEIPTPIGPESPIPFDSLRFGGSRAGPCVLWAPRLAAVLITRASGLIALAVREAPQGSLVTRLWRRLRHTPNPASVFDVSSAPGIVAVLSGTGADDEARLVDLYSTDGSYRRTLRLPDRALRIAGDGERLYALLQSGDRIFLASIILPWDLREPMRRTAVR